MSESFPDMDPALEGIAQRFEEMSLRREQERLEWVAKNGPHCAWLKERADWVGTVEGLEAFAVKSPMWDKLDGLSFSMKVGYCGYVVFPTRPVIEPGYDGIVATCPFMGASHLLRSMMGKSVTASTRRTLTLINTPSGISNGSRGRSLSW